MDLSSSLRESIACEHRQKAQPHHWIDGGTEEIWLIRSTVCSTSATNKRNKRLETPLFEKIQSTAVRIVPLVDVLSRMAPGHIESEFALP